MNTTYTARVESIKKNQKRLQEKNAEAGGDCVAMLGLSPTRGKTGGKNSPFYFSEQINDQIEKWELSVDPLFSATINPKATKRFIQFIGAVLHRQYGQIDKTTACILLGLHLAGDFPLTSDALWEIATGGKVRSEGMGADRRGVSTRTVKRLIGAVGVSTVGTQLSRSVGKNGFLQIVGATWGEPGKRDQVVKLNRSHPMVIEFINMIERATEAQITEMVGDKQ